MSRILILRFEKAVWKQVFEAGTRFQIKNTKGYVGIDYIDDADPYRGYCVQITDRTPSEPFSMGLRFISSDGKVIDDGLPINIAWNKKSARYQEIVSNDGADTFAPEITNPPHINTQKRCCDGQMIVPAKKR